MKSKWYKGLLEAEQLVKDGFYVDYSDFTSEYVWFVKSGQPYIQYGIPLKETERVLGVVDYIKHREEVLNK